ncbi:MAG: hypothetical protein O7A71_08070 [Chloroflexi bacterium]|nr:hypothetical protein [Chloroflexota bacterium]
MSPELAWLDCLSGGRVIAGFVLGTTMDFAYSYGIPPIERDLWDDQEDRWTPVASRPPIMQAQSAS